MNIKPYHYGEAFLWFHTLLNSDNKYSSFMDEFKNKIHNFALRQSSRNTLQKKAFLPLCTSTNGTFKHFD